MGTLMSVDESVNHILEILENAHQRCTYNALAGYLDIDMPRLFSALGLRRPRASWIVNQESLKPTKYTAEQEHENLYDHPHVISDAAELASFLDTPRKESSQRSMDTACYGVDGCKGGWIFARLEGDSISFGTVKTIGNLVSKAEANSRIFIDIPIGLRDDSPEERVCDIQARRVLKPHRARSVFPAPIRPLLGLSDYKDANNMSKSLIGKGISKQSFHIMRKIQEVDDLLANDIRARGMIREVHPELCFWALAGGSAMEHSKKSEEGFSERLGHIQRYLANASRAIFHAIDHYARSTVAKDDILDAAVAAITASHPDRWAILPTNPEYDSTGLPMEMVYLK
jgi:predicted RNase H-like nuclease